MAALVVNQEKWVTVTLGGYLGKAFGRTHKFYVSTTQEALKALRMQLKGFKELLSTAESKGITFSVFNGKHNIKDEDSFKFACKDRLRIIPTYIGSKRAGVLQTVLGVVLIAASYFTGGSTLGPGIALLAGGAVQLLTPQPQGLKVKQDADNSASYAFGGPVNTTAQGNPIGVLYGKREVGGAIISAGILAEDQQ